jgi:hypothetical protein
MQSTENNFEAVIAASEDDVDDEYESVGDHHRAAAEHFAAAARHHLAAADAEDKGDSDTADRHAYLAYRQRLNGVQYAEIAVMDSERVEDEIEGDL